MPHYESSRDAQYISFHSRLAKCDTYRARIGSFISRRNVNCDVEKQKIVNMKERFRLRIGLKAVDSQLNTECSEKDIYTIAEYDFDWKVVGRRLIGEQKVNDIEREGSNEKDKRDKMLLEWRKAKSHDATYQALVNVLRSIENITTANRVEELMQRISRPQACERQLIRLSGSVTSPAATGCMLRQKFENVARKNCPDFHSPTLLAANAIAEERPAEVLLLIFYSEVTFVGRIIVWHTETIALGHGVISTSAS
ncbi:hypothetical protein EMCRGX_G002238 [Ephydatia muelleri]